MRETLAQANTRTQAARAANHDCPLSHPPSPATHHVHPFTFPPPPLNANIPARRAASLGTPHGVFGILWQAADG